MTVQNALQTPADCASQCNSTASATRLRWLHRCSEISFSSVRRARDLATDQVRAVFSQAIGAWTDVACTGARTGLDVSVSADTNACDVATYFPSSPNVNSIMFVSSGWTQRNHDARAFALTLVFHDPTNGEIVDVDMEINEQRGRYAICPDTGCTDGDIDLRNVVTHEMGHYFGIAHSDVAAATMFCSADSREIIKRDLDADDATAICTVYPPGRLAPLCNRTPINGLGLSCRPRSCACAAPGSERAASTVSLFVLVGLLSLMVARFAK